MSDKPRYGGLILGLRGNGDQKLGDGVSKGVKNSSPKMNKIFDSKFNVDYDFATKHYLTQRFDQIMIVEVECPKTAKGAIILTSLDI